MAKSLRERLALAHAEATGQTGDGYPEGLLVKRLAEAVGQWLNEVERDPSWKHSDVDRLARTVVFRVLREEINQK